MPTSATFARAKCALRLGFWSGLALSAACADAAHRPPDNPASHNDVMCRYVGLESVESESEQKSERDNLSLLATYRFRESNVPPAKDPLTVKFQVERSRVNELRGHLESQPDVICNPDNDAHYRVRVKPFPTTSPASAVAKPAPAQGAVPEEGADAVNPQLPSDPVGE
jgi:hypothetical protein